MEPIDLLKDLPGWHATLSGSNTPEAINNRATTHVIKRLTNETGLSFAAGAEPGTVFTKLTAQEAANVKATLAAMEPAQKVAAFGRVARYGVNEETGELAVSNIPVWRGDPQGVLAVELMKAEMAGNGKRGPVLRGLLAGDLEAVRTGLENTGPAVERQDVQAVPNMPDTRTDAQKAYGNYQTAIQPVRDATRRVQNLFSWSRAPDPGPPLDYVQLYKAMRASEEREALNPEDQSRYPR